MNLQICIIVEPIILLGIRHTPSAPSPVSPIWFQRDRHCPNFPLRIGITAIRTLEPPVQADIRAMVGRTFDVRKDTPAFDHCSDGEIGGGRLEGGSQLPVQRTVTYGDHRFARHASRKGNHAVRWRKEFFAFLHVEIDSPMP